MSGTVQKCSLCDWWAWIHPHDGSEYGADERGLAAFVGHVAITHPERYGEVLQVWLERVMEEEVARRRKKCDGKTHKDQTFVSQYPAGWKCEGCEQVITGRQLEQQLNRQTGGSGK